MSDQLAIALVVGGITAFVSLATTGANLWFQNKREKDSRAADLERDRVQQTHELRRDRQARLLELRLADYRERAKACEALFASVRQISVMAEIRQRAAEQWNKLHSEESIAAYNADADAYKQSLDLAESHAGEALQLLSIDEDAAKVIDAYPSVHSNSFVDAPMEPDVRRAWLEAVEVLRQAIFDYLRVLRERLIADELTRKE